jgi:hypothetical protein
VNALAAQYRPIRVSADAIVEWFFCACIILPSGSIGGFNVKQPLFIATLLAIGVRPRHFGLTKAMVRNAIFLVAVLFAWVPLAYCTGRSDGVLPLLQFKDIIVTGFTAFIVSLYVTNETKRDRFVRLVIYCVGVTSAIKALSYVYAATTGTSVFDIINLIDRVFDQNLVTFDIGDIGGRFQFTSDSLVPVSLYALLGRKGRFGIPDNLAVPLTILLVFSSIAAFSRFIWLYSAIAIGLGVISTRPDRTKVAYVVLAGLIAAYFWEELSSLYELRTSDYNIDFSDGLRDEQRVPLLKFVAEAPVFGHGLGTFTAEIIREPEYKYSYELQLVALVGQIGIVGCSLVAIAVAYYYRSIAAFKGRVLDVFSVATLLAIWIATGFENPWLMSSSAGIAFGLLFALGRPPEQPSAFGAIPRG